MEVKIISEKNNPLFNRNEVRFEVVHESETTPDLVKVRGELAKKTGSDSSHVVIDGFKTLFGIGRTIGDARIYKDMAEMKDYEPLYLLKRNKLVQDEKKKESEAAETPKEVPKKEAPKEEKKPAPAGPTEEELVEEEIRAEEDKKAKRLKEEREQRESEE